jgi:hypothetical protein
MSSDTAVHSRRLWLATAVPPPHTFSTQKRDRNPFCVAVDNREGYPYNTGIIV